MKLVAERAHLLAALARAARIIERRNTIPVLGNVRLDAAAGKLHLRATDLDIDLTDNLPAVIGAPGAATAPGHMLHDIVRKLPDGSHVTIEDADNGLLMVSAGRSRFKIATIPPEDFPNIVAGDLPHRFQVPAKEFKAALDRAAFAISSEEVRYYLGGIHFHRVADALRAVATDGHQLAQVTLSAGTGAEGMPGVIVPRKTVTEVSRLLADETSSIEIGLSAQKIQFTLGDITLTSKLIDGIFPDYERVVPKTNEIVATIDKAALVKAVERVATVTTTSARAVKMALAGRTLTLTVRNTDIGGDAVDELEVDAEDDTAIEIGFNHRYLLDILSNIHGETIKIALANAGAPALIEDATPSGALFVLMPMRVQ